MSDTDFSTYRRLSSPRRISKWTAIGVVERNFVELSLAADRLERRLARGFELARHPRADTGNKHIRIRAGPGIEQVAADTASKGHPFDTVGALEREGEDNRIRLVFGLAADTSRYRPRPVVISNAM